MKIILGGLVILLLAGFAFTQMPASHEVAELTQAPAHALTDKPRISQQSVVHYRFSYPLDAFQRKLEQFRLDNRTYTEPVNHPCRQQQRIQDRTECAEAGYDWHFNNRQPVITVVNGRSLEIKLPTYLNGKAWVRGENISLREETSGLVLHSQMDGVVRLDMQLDEQACLKISATPQILWSGPSRLLLFNGQLEDVKEAVERRLLPHLEDFARQLQESLFQCADVAEVMARIAQPVDIDEDGATDEKTLQIRPRLLSYEGLKMGEAFIELDLLAEVENATASPASAQHELIISSRPHSGEARYYLSAPVIISYEDLAVELSRQFAARPWRTANRYGEHDIQVQSVETWPAGTSLVMAIQFRGSHSERLSGSNARYYLKTLPQLGADAKSLLFEPQEVTAAVNDKEWAFYRRALNETLEQALADGEIAISLPRQVVEEESQLRVMLESSELLQFNNIDSGFAGVVLEAQQLVIDRGLYADAEMTMEWLDQ